MKRWDNESRSERGEREKERERELGLDGGDATRTSAGI
jgi:hypothetical protein